MTNDFLRTILGRLKGGEGLADALLSHVEPMNDGERWQHMIALGRRARTDASAQAQIHALAREPNFYPQRLALMAAQASGDADVILAALVSPSLALFGFAVDAAVAHLDEGLLAALLLALSRERRKTLARRCAERRRTGVVERAFDGLPLRDRRQVIGYAGAAFVARKLGDPEFVETLGAAHWGRLARRHPAIARAVLAARLEREDEAPHHVVTATCVSIRRMATVSTTDALALLQVAARHIPLAALPIRAIAMVHPREVAALVLADRAEAPPPLPLALLRKVDDDTRITLLRLRGTGIDADELRRLEASSRRRLHAAGVLESARTAAGALPPALVAHLPSAERMIEARRGWTAPDHAAFPAMRLPYLACMPFADALAEGRPWIAQPDGALRATAIAAIIGAGRYEAAALPAILELVQSRRNEQDPVRQAMIGALAALPPTRWTEACLPALSAIVDAALTARDCSAGTLACAARLVMGMAPQHIEFTARELTRILEKTGSAPRLDLEGRLSDAQMVRLTEHILPLIRTWLARSKTAAIFTFMRSFGRRVRAAPPLIEQLVKMTRDSRRDAAAPALDMLVALRVPGLTATLIPELLAAEAGWVLTHAVAGHLQRKRQDLLDEFLVPRVYSGRFSTNKTPVLPGFGRHFRRWTRRQQDRFASSLFDIARSGRRSLWELRNVIPTVARMPAAGVEPIVELARLDAMDPLLRDIALSALGRVDGARGVPTLVAALEDKRARIAVYALRDALLNVPAEAAIHILRRALRREVTVTKEVARLAGEISGEEARAFLSELLQQPDLHRDVRIAVLRGLWNDLESDETWRLLAAAAQADEATARATIRVPDEQLSPRARGRLAEHLGVLLRHDAPQVRLETLERLVSRPVAVVGAAPMMRVLHDLLSRPTETEVGTAAAALALCTPVGEANALGATFASVPSPRGLAAVVNALATSSRTRPARITPIAQAAVDQLLAMQRHTGLAMRLAVAALPASALEALVRRLSHDGRLHAGVLMEALAALPGVANLRRGTDLDALEPRLAALEQPAARRIGLEILVTRARVQGWSRAARDRLAAYREDPDPLVAEAAELATPPAATAAS
jgi:hypothetical protein